MDIDIIYIYIYTCLSTLLKIWSSENSPKEISMYKLVNKYIYFYILR